MNDEYWKKMLNSYFKDLNILSKQLKPFEEIKQTLEKYQQPSIDIQNMYPSFYYEQQKLQKLIDEIKIYDPIQNYIVKYSEDIDRYKKSMLDMFSPAMEQMKRSFEELPPRIKEALLTLAEHGWYLDFNMGFSDLWDVKDALNSGDITEVEEALIEYYEEQLDSIEDYIHNQCSNRSHIISSAFQAHREEKYYLSIPVIFTQVDGICKDTVNEYFFIKQRGTNKPRTANYVQQITTDTFQIALLSPLENTTPINASERYRDENFDLLNRHMVLHGESLDYGNKINSLKAISLINYVVQVLDQDKEYP